MQARSAGSNKYINVDIVIGKNRCSYTFDVAVTKLGNGQNCGEASEVHVLERCLAQNLGIRWEILSCFGCLAQVEPST